MGMRSAPVLWTSVPALLVASGVYWFLAEDYRLDRLYAWLICVNAVALPLWAFDKLQSKRKRFRVPEKSLHLLSVLGAAPMALLVMKFLRHKTLHRSFWVINGLFLVVWGALVFFWLSRP